MDIPTAEIVKVVAALLVAAGVGFGTNGMNSTKVDNALAMAELATKERAEMRDDHAAEKLEMVINMRGTCEKEKKAIRMFYDHPHGGDDQ